MSNPASEFLREAATKSADLTHRQLIRQGIDKYNEAFERGRSRYFNWEAAREKCREIKSEAVNHLDRYLLQFEEKIKARGGHVFWAENSEEARAYITDLARRHNVRTIVKSKSMVAEEIHLAPALEKQGIKVYETDLGEFIVQLRNEPPYHIVTPAMHLSRARNFRALQRKARRRRHSRSLRTRRHRPPLAAAHFFRRRNGHQRREFSGRRFRNDRHHHQ